MEGKQSRMKPYNLASTISQRLMQNDGVFMIAGLRIFALCICGILVFSAVMIRKSYADYKKNNELPDIYGYLDPSDSEYEMTLYYYSYIKDIIIYLNRMIYMASAKEASFLIKHGKNETGLI